MYDKGMRASCDKCRPNCRQTKYTTSIASTPLTPKHMEEYRKRYSPRLLYEFKLNSDMNILSFAYIINLCNLN